MTDDFPGSCFLDHTTHTCPTVAYDASLGLYAFQAAGGRPVLTVESLHHLSAAVSLSPACVCVCFLFSVFFLVDNSNTDTAQALKWGKKGTIIMYKKTVREFEV